MKHEADVKEKTLQILVFNLLNEELGLDISCVREVLKLGEIHPLVQAPDFIEGVINVRDYIIAVIDLRKKFNLVPIEDKSKMRIIVCRVNTFIVGLIVDSVTEVLSLHQQDIQPTPGIISIQTKDSNLSGIVRVGERVIAILDLQKLLTSEEISRLSMLRK